MPNTKQSRKGKQKAGDLISAAASVTFGEIWQLDGLADRTKSTRIQRGYINKSEFCDSIGISRQYLSNIELGITQRPEAMPMLKIARALNVSIYWLLTGEGTQTGAELEISPQEAALLHALRSAKPDEHKVVELILKPYLTPHKKT